MSACLLLAPYGTEDKPAPYADLVRAQRPTALQVTEATAILGLFAERSYLCPRD